MQGLPKKKHVRAFLIIDKVALSWMHGTRFHRLQGVAGGIEIEGIANCGTADAELAPRAAALLQDPRPALAELRPKSAYIAWRRAFGYSSRAVGGV